MTSISIYIYIQGPVKGTHLILTALQRLKVLRVLESLGVAG